MFNDDAGFELVNFQAQRDLVSLVKHDETRTVNHDRTTTIDNDETVTVHGFRTETVDKDETITIHQNRTEVVDLDETITIHKNRKERVDENETLDIGGNRDETVHKSEQITIKGNRDKTVNGNDTLTVNKDRKETVNKSRSLKVDRNNTEFVKMGKSVTVGLAYATQVGTIMNTAVGIMQAEEIGRIKKTMVGKSYSISVGDKFEISVGSSKITMTQDSISITAKSILVGAENENVIIGKDVLINPPGAVDGGGKNVGGQGQLQGPPGKKRHVNTPLGKLRPLTAGEKAMVEDVFGDSVNADKIRIHNQKYFPGLPDNTAVTPNGQLYYGPDVFLDDFSMGDNKDKHLFIHEMTHVWQHQNGTNVADMGGAEQFSKSITGFDPYPYDLDMDKRLGNYGLEQQASIVSDYYATRKRYSDIRLRDKSNPNREKYEDFLGIFLTDPKHDSLQPKKANTGSSSVPPVASRHR